MPGARGGIFIPIVGDEADLVKALQHAQRELERMGASAVKQGATAGGALRRLGAAGGIIKSKLLGPLQGLGPALGVAGILKFGKDSVGAFHEAELAGVAMGNSLKHNKLLAGETAESFEKLSKEIQSKTAADDESVQSAIASLADFKLTGKQIRETIPLVVDYARRTGKSVPDAAKTLGTAMLGNTRALKLVGIKYKSTGDEARDYTNITGLLRDKVGGFAQEEAKTTAVRMEIMKNRFNDLQEVVGSKVVGAFAFLTEHLNIVGPVVGVLVAGMLTYKAVMLASTITTALFGQAAGAAWAAAAGPVALVVAAVVGLGFVIFKFRRQIVGALKAVASFFVNVFTGIRNFAVTWGARFLAIVTAPARAWLAGFRAVRTGIVAVFTWVKDKALGIIEKLKGGFSKAAEFIGAVFKAPINLVIDALNFLIRGLNKVQIAVPGWVPGIGGKGFGFSIPEIPRLAQGGIVTAPTLALLGDNRSGREAIVPLPRRGGLGGVVVHVHVAGSVTAERDLARAIRDELVRLGRRNRDTGLAAFA